VSESLYWYVAKGLFGNDGRSGDRSVAESFARKKWL